MAKPTGVEQYTIKYLKGRGYKITPEDAKRILFWEHTFSGVSECNVPEKLEPVLDEVHSADHDATLADLRHFVLCLLKQAEELIDDSDNGEMTTLHDIFFADYEEDEEDEEEVSPEVSPGVSEAFAKIKKMKKEEDV